MIPSIFKEMQKAEDSDSFDSCNEDDETESLEKKPKLTGNPFLDFNQEIIDIENEDEDEASKYICSFQLNCN